MNYYKQMEQNIEKMKEFDTNISNKVNELKDTVSKLDFNGMVASDDAKQVTAHKNRTLRVVKRVIDKFEKEIEQYILPLINVDVTNEDIEESKED